MNKIIRATIDHCDQLPEIAKISFLDAHGTSAPKGDIDAFMEDYWKSDKLQFIGSKGVTYGWQQTKDNYKRGYPDLATMGQLSFEIIKIDILSDAAAIMIGRYTLTRAKDQPTGLFTLIWKKIDGRWLIVSDQTCG